MDKTDLEIYKNCFVKLTKRDGYFFKGYVSVVSDTAITLMDISKHTVSISFDEISFIRTLDAVEIKKAEEQIEQCSAEKEIRGND